MRITAVILAPILLLFLLCSPLAADRNVGTIQLSANPMSIVADGKSICTIVAQVRDGQGNLVPNDTEVRFSSSMGVIDEIGRTSAGVARVKLISSDIKGTAIVTATWLEGEAVSQIKVEFGDSMVVAKGPQYISVTADKYMGYSIDYKVLDCVGKVRIRYRALEIEAGQAQVDLVQQKIIAKGDSISGPVKINTKDGSVTGNALFTDLSGRAVIISGEKAVAQELDLSHGPPVLAGPAKDFNNQDFEFKDLSDSNGLIKCKSATIFLNEKIQFTGAALYLNGKRKFALPLYVLSLNGFEVDGQPYLDYSTNNGIALNLPYYYALSPSSTGAFIIRHGTNSGWGSYGQTPGWGLDMRQKYSTETSQGSVELSQITSSQWGVHFQHGQQFGPSTQSYLYLDFPAHKDLFGNFNVDRSFNEFNLGMNLSGSRMYDGSNSVNGDLYAQTKPKQIGKSIFRYTLSSRLSYSQSTENFSSGTLIPLPTTLVPANGKSYLQPSVQSNISTSPYKLAKNVSLTSSLGLGYIWGNAVSVGGLSSLGTTMLDWRFSPKSSLQLSYRYADRPSVYTTLGGKQSLSASWRYDSDKWQTGFYAVKGLDYHSMNLFADLSYRVTPLWRLGVRSTFNEFGNQSYNDLEFGLGRKIGTREILAVWSKSQHRIMFQLGSSSF